MQKILSVLIAALFLSCSDDGVGSQNSNINNSIGTCGGKEYDATLYDCVRGEIVGSCLDRNYYPEYERCENGEIKSNVGISSSSIQASSSSFAASSSSGLDPSSSSNVISSSSSFEPSSSSNVVNYSSSIEPSSSSSFVSSSSISYGTLTYQGQTYKTVQIGTQVWMAENLNYKGVCYDNNPSNCRTYGSLCNWATAMNLNLSCNSSNNCTSQVQPKHRGICPSGWHIPSDAEWTILTDYVGGWRIAGTKLKATSGWNTTYNNYIAGTDDYGFSALPSGFGDPLGYAGEPDGFLGIGNISHWWSSTSVDNFTVNYLSSRLTMTYTDTWAQIGDSDRPFLHSVRCVQD